MLPHKMNEFCYPDAFFFFFFIMVTTASEMEETSSGAALSNLNCFTMLSCSCLLREICLCHVLEDVGLSRHLFSLFSRSVAKKLHNENMN